MPQTVSSAKPAHQKHPDTNLANWRLHPHSQWAFQNVRSLIPTANIAAAQSADALPAGTAGSLDSLAVAGTDGRTLAEYLSESGADSMVVLRDGKKSWRWSAPHHDKQSPHIVFSVSKSITALLAGILAEQKIIDVAQRVSYYLPATRGSAYEDCTLQHVLDMTVALGFEEDYLNPVGDFFDYRNATCWNPVDQTKENKTLEQFLYDLKKADFEHGEIFNYKSPNTDLLGILLERAAGIPLSDLLSTLLWQPMGAQTDAYITVDSVNAPRAAGGICVTIEDLARLGQLVLNHGAVGSSSVVPESWIHNTLTGGDRDAWSRGNFATLLPAGRYCNKWYQVGNDDGCVTAIGIHGQWLYLNPQTRVVIALLSSQSDPLNDQRDIELLRVLEMITQACG